MKTYTFNETFDLINPVTLTEEQAHLLNNIKCGVSDEYIVAGDALVKVLIPVDEFETSPCYRRVVAKVEELSIKDWRYFRGETPRVALPSEIEHD